MSIISHFREKVKSLGNNRRELATSKAQSSRNCAVKLVKTGAASFYIVMFATLLLSIVAVSFATIAISQMVRTSNDDLSNSAYDSALAGVEDAKLAILDYESCRAGRITQGSSGMACDKIIKIMEGQAAGYTGDNQDCDKVGRIMGRYGSEDKGGEVMVQESATTSGSSTNSAGSNSMAQAYTCVKIETNLDDYKSTLTADNSSRMVKVNLSGNANDVAYVRVKWFSRQNGNASGANYLSSGKLKFPRVSNIGTPPVLSVTLVQTGDSFTEQKIVNGSGESTDLGLVYLVPALDQGSTSHGVTNDSYISALDNRITRSEIAATDDKSSRNLPFLVNCSSSFNYSGYACQTDLYLPSPASGSTRNPETFLLLLSLPYRQPATTDFVLEFYDASGNLIKTSGMQYDVDSTGRASDLYRRVETRLVTSNAYYPFPDAELTATDEGAGAGINKFVTTQLESHFGW